MNPYRRLEVDRDQFLDSAQEASGDFTVEALCAATVGFLAVRGNRLGIMTDAAHILAGVTALKASVSAARFGNAMHGVRQTDLAMEQYQADKRQALTRDGE